jgi:hypothetical protein
LHGGNRIAGNGRHVEGARDVGRAEEGGHQGIQSQEGRPGGHVLGRDERLLLLRPGAGDPIKVLALQHGTTTLWQGLPVLVPVLLGGFTTNFIWCADAECTNQSAGHEYFSSDE